MQELLPPTDIPTDDISIDTAFSALTRDLQDVPPTCQFVYHCPKHGPEPCEYRARWVAVMRCHEHSADPCEFRMLICDPCHDELVADGNQTRNATVLEWLPL